MASTCARCRCAACAATWRWCAPSKLFPGTVLENLRLGREDLSYTDITRALDDVGLLEELLAMPDGLDTELHPHGRPLSHRQACRLMIARAIAGRPRLIIIDGALDQIDRREDDQRLTSVLFAPDAPWTLVCVTDRPDLLAQCSRVVLPEGRRSPRRGPGGVRR